MCACTVLVGTVIVVLGDIVEGILVVEMGG